MKIIAFQLSLFCKNYRFSKTVLYIINRKIHGCLEIPDLFLVLNISHSFAALTLEISCSTLEINLVFPRTHVLFSIYKNKPSFWNCKLSTSLRRNITIIMNAVFWNVWFSINLILRVFISTTPPPPPEVKNLFKSFTLFTGIRIFFLYIYILY